MYAKIGITLIVTGVMMTAKGIAGLVEIRRNIKMRNLEFNLTETGGSKNV